MPHGELPDGEFGRSIAEGARGTAPWRWILWLTAVLTLYVGFGVVTPHSSSRTPIVVAGTLLLVASVVPWRHVFRSWRSRFYLRVTGVMREKSDATQRAYADLDRSHLWLIRSIDGFVPEQFVAKHALIVAALERARMSRRSSLPLVDRTRAVLTARAEADTLRREIVATAESPEELQYAKTLREIAASMRQASDAAVAEVERIASEALWRLERLRPPGCAAQTHAALCAAHRTYFESLVAFGKASGADDLADATEKAEIVERRRAEVDRTTEMLWAACD